jgi:HD-GYP domain-containing protein (c-di-GMP phosphodiesterase class II)
LIKKITIDQLKPGMYVADLNNQWIPKNNATRSGLVKSQAIIDKVKGLGVTELYIDASKGVDCPEGIPVDAVKQLQAQQFQSITAQSGVSPLRTPVEKERDRAEKSYTAAKNLVGNILEDVKNGKGVDALAVEDSAGDIIESLNTNENALACLSHIRSKDEYLLEHSVNVGLLLGIFARARRLDENTSRQLIAGGLLHDIGKILVPDEILNKPGKLEAEEWEEMKRHVDYGEQILDVTPGLSDLTRSICRLHHERLDGSGYPRNLPEQEISMYGRMSAICDVYDAVTADRVYHKGMAPNDALKKLIEWSIFHLDKELVYDFIRCLSVYPVGTLVELSNGRAGVVIEANRRQPKHPRVKVFYNTRHEHQIEPVVIDLADKKTDIDVVNTLDARALNLDIRPFL